MTDNTPHPFSLIAEFNETQTTKRSAYRKKVAASKKPTKGSEDSGGADVAMEGTEGDTSAGVDNTTITSAAGSATGSGHHRAKKAKTDADAKMMDVDEELNDASDPESVPDEEEDEEDEDVQEEEEEEDEEEDQDELEEREDKPDDEDEALDDGNHSD